MGQAGTLYFGQPQIDLDLKKEELPLRKIVVRHGEATVGNDIPQVIFSDCSTQRNLSQAGRMQAVTYGEVLRKLLIPVQFPVTASPFCRTKETAELAFGEENVQVDHFWLNIYHLNGDLTTAEKESVLMSLSSVLEINAHG